MSANNSTQSLRPAGKPPITLDGDARPKASSAIAPLTDVAFLLLIYFIVTSTLLPKEGDLGMSLPGSDGKPIMTIDNLLLRISAQGSILAGAEATIALEDDELDATLAQYQKICKATGNLPVVTLDAHDDALHGRFITVINSLSKLGINDVQIVANQSE